MGNNLRIRVEIKGDKEFLKNLKKISRNATRRALGKAAKAGMEPILKRMGVLAPVDTGKLEASFRSKFAYRSSRAVRVIAMTNMKLDPKKKSRHTYDFYQELGTSQHAAQPFARPAADEMAEIAIEITRSIMEKAVLEEVRNLGVR